MKRPGELTSGSSSSVVMYVHPSFFAKDVTFPLNPLSSNWHWPSADLKFTDLQAAKETHFNTHPILDCELNDRRIDPESTMPSSVIEKLANALQLCLCMVKCTPIVTLIIINNNFNIFRLLLSLKASHTQIDSSVCTSPNN